MVRRTRCKADPDLVMRDHEHGFVEAVLEVPDDTPIVIAHASIREGHRRGYWVIHVDRDNYSDRIRTKTEAIRTLDVWAAQFRREMEDSERHWREAYPQSHAAMKRQGDGCSTCALLEHQRAS